MYQVTFIIIQVHFLPGDGRMDSPGFSAKYCTYTAMDCKSKRILDIQVIDKRETGLKSPNMELMGLNKVRGHLEKKKITVVEIVTDAHPQIMAMLSKYNYVRILNCFWALVFFICIYRWLKALCENIRYKIQDTRYFITQ